MRFNDNNSVILKIILISKGCYNAKLNTSPTKRGFSAKFLVGVCRSKFKNGAVRLDEPVFQTITKESGGDGLEHRLG